MKKRKICVVLTTRGNYAKMKSVIAGIEASEDLELQLIIGGMVVLEKYGRILNSPEGRRLVPDRIINFVIEGETPVTMAKSAGLATMDFATAFENLTPDVVVVIADRFECLPIAMAAAYMNIAVVHIEGGEVSGSIDESIRHAITKLSHLHFPASQDAAERIARMGEAQENIFKVGGTSLDVIRQMDLNDLDPIRRYQRIWGMGPEIEIDPTKYLIVIQHPVTTEYEENSQNVDETLAAIVNLAIPTIWVMPNMDAGSDGIHKAIRHFREDRGENCIHFFKSIPIELFAPVLYNAACILGNSSSGIRESAFLGTPSVNIGTRQHGRERGANVIDVDYNRSAIVDAVRKQIDHGRYESDPLYGDGYASEKIVEILRTHEFTIQKTINF